MSKYKCIIKCKSQSESNMQIQGMQLLGKGVERVVSGCFRFAYSYKVDFSESKNANLSILLWSLKVIFSDIF